MSKPMYQRFTYAARATLPTNIDSDILITGWRGESRLPFAFDVVDGSITYTAGTGVRATMNATVVAERGMFDELSTWGATVRVWWRHYHIDGTVETIPLAVIDVDSARVSYGNGGDVIQFAGSDPWARVIAARFTVPQQPRGNLTDTVLSWVRGAIGTLPAVDAAGQAVPDDITRSNVNLSRHVFEDDRSDAVKMLLDSVGQEAFVYRDGSLVIRPAPVLTGPSAWTVRAGSGGMLVGGDRARSRDGFYNAVIVRPTSPIQGFPTFELRDNDPTSPTRVRPGLYVPVFISNPAFRSRAQAEAAARVHLSHGTSASASLELTTAPHPAIDPGDVVSVQLPDTDGNAGVTERHLVETTTLNFKAGPQPFSTRSARPSGSGDELLT